MIMQGKGVSGGLAGGNLFFYRRGETGLLRTSAEDSKAERRRLEDALAKSIQQLEDLALSCCTEEGSQAAALFRAHALLMQDAAFEQAIQDILDAENCNAEYAVSMAGQALADTFAGMEDSYFKARAADMQDITHRLLQNLMDPAGTDAIISKEPVILVAEDLTPSEFMQLTRSKVLGLALTAGSEYSHTAILARILGIPAVFGFGDWPDRTYEGEAAYLDGDRGQLILMPDEDTLPVLRQELLRQQERRKELEAMKGQADVTPDGRQIDVYCNISAPEDLAAVIANDGHGIGLFRSEFLYLASAELPTEDAQFAVYRSILAGMEGRCVRIRTLDIGADKRAAYLWAGRQEKPEQELRGIRFCLRHPEIFRTQLRALYRASAYGRLAILFPMITSLWEVEACKEFVRSVQEELKAEGIPYNLELPIGIMIETPEAVRNAGELAGHVDFFSVGTNDLLRSMREGSTSCIPALLAALKQTADAAHDRGIRIGICGELAADPAYLPEFLAMGIDELSVSPPSVLPLRAAIRS